jgi:hypothetical protein
MVDPDLDRFLIDADCDGALVETRSVAETTLSRRGVVGLSLAGAAAILLGRASGAAAKGGVSASDVGILNYALVLEYLQAAFYTEAERSGALKGKAAQAATVVGATERAHVKAFRKLLGPQAVKKPLFDFQGTTEQQQAFLKTAVALEDLAVAAYKGQAPKLQSNAVLAAAVGIHSVEARHAAWMRELFGITPAVHAFDQAASRPQVTRLVASTKFIVSKPRVQGRGSPNFTG